MKNVWAVEGLSPFWALLSLPVWHGKMEKVGTGYRQGSSLIGQTHWLSSKTFSPHLEPKKRRTLRSSRQSILFLVLSEGKVFFFVVLFFKSASNFIPSAFIPFLPFLSEVNAAPFCNFSWRVVLCSLVTAHSKGLAQPGYYKRVMVVMRESFLYEKMCVNQKNFVMLGCLTQRSSGKSLFYAWWFVWNTTTSLFYAVLTFREKRTWEDLLHSTALKVTINRYKRWRGLLLNCNCLWIRGIKHINIVIGK